MDYISKTLNAFLANKGISIEYQLSFDLVLFDKNYIQVDSF